MNWLIGLYFALFSPFPEDGSRANVPDMDSILFEILSEGEYEFLGQMQEVVGEYFAEGGDPDFRQDDSEGGDPDIRRDDKERSDDKEGRVVRQIATVTVSPATISDGVGFRYRLKINRYNHWEARFLADQDPGEQFRTYPLPGIPSHCSGGLILRPGGWIRDAVIGDFQVNAGFGAMLASAPVFSITLGEPGLLHRPGTGIRLHPGTDENRFFRGVAAKMARGRSELILFGTGRQTVVGKDSVAQEGCGIIYDLRFTNYNLGAGVVGFNHDSLSFGQEEWGSQFSSRTEAFIRTGMWGQCRLPFVIIFGEAAWSPDLGGAGVAGLRFFESHGFSAVIRFTGSTPDYPVWFSRFHTGTAPNRSRNDCTLSLKYVPNRRLVLYGSVLTQLDTWPDGDKFLRPTTKISQRTTWQLPNRWMAALTSTIGFGENENVYPDAAGYKIQLDTDPEIKGIVRFRAGIQQTFAGYGSRIIYGTTGDLTVGLRLMEGRFRMISGCRVFSVKPGVPPLYAYEPDILYGWSAPVLSGSGTRWFLTLRWVPISGLSIEGKVYQSGYSDLDHWSEDQRAGFKLQVAFTSQ
ncbi:MAG: hypothetical protein A2X22_01155 [Bacteroidetes bacterium GWF2_49_14]|nr:MAG: hypothetical protein A2X22_01155 [Bacteroidetes bacterium GWF2_49_14]